MAHEPKTRQDRIEKVFLVCWWEPEVTNIESVHRTYAGAVLSWNAVRLRRLAERESEIRETGSEEQKAHAQKIVASLSCNDPEKMDRYAYDTPYIEEMVLAD